MKIIHLYVLLLVFLLASPAYAQIEDLKKKSDEHKKEEQDKDKKREKSNAYQGGEDFGDACMSSCAEMACQLGTSILVQTLVQHHRHMIQNRDMYPSAVAFDIMPQAAYGPIDEYWNILPQLRGSYGVLATDIRMNYLLETTSEGAETFQVWEWQVLQLNFMWTPQFIMRIGSGIYFEQYNENLYNEHSLSIELLPDRFLSFAAEGRLALDYEQVADNPVFSEVSFRAGIPVFNTGSLRGWITGGFVRQSYYGSVNLTSILGGFRFMIY